MPVNKEECVHVFEGSVQIDSPFMIECLMWSPDCLLQYSYVVPQVSGSSSQIVSCSVVFQSQGQDHVWSAHHALSMTTMSSRHPATKTSRYMQVAATVFCKRQTRQTSWLCVYSVLVWNDLCIFVTSPLEEVMKNANLSFVLVKLGFCCCLVNVKLLN